MWSVPHTASRSWPRVNTRPGGYGESLRDSATLMLRSLYAAQRLADGTVLRLSIAQNSILTLALGMAHSAYPAFAEAPPPAI